MNTLSDSSETLSDFFEDLQKRRNEGEELSEAEENYCLAIESGYSYYVADLVYMQADGQKLSIGEEIYLEAKFEGYGDEEAEEMASRAEGEFAGRFKEHIENPSVEWSEAVETFREKFFDTPGKRAFKAAKAAGLDDVTADLMAQQAENNELSPGDLAYLDARRAGQSEYVAELLSKQVSGNPLEPEEAAYLETKLQGMSDELADRVAESVTKAVQKAKLRIRTSLLN